VKMKADWTKRNPEITEALKKFGRSGVPLYVIYTGNPGQAPEILPQVLTPEIVIEKLAVANVH
jgi:thiol:disulfide interchange protein